MKPSKLIISGWGPYKDKVEINFDKIGKDNIFLITGSTGAGKTTVLDVISFALFGAVSGENRGKDRLRSDYAKSDTETFVELTFFHKNERYRIKRNPKYYRPKKSGIGETLQEEDAELQIGENEPIVGKRDVNPKIKELLGVTHEQFKQISMIAQGEFVKLLFADAEDKITIFRNIFNTDIYAKIEKSIKNLAIKLYKEREELYSKMVENIYYIKASNNVELTEAINNENKNIKLILELLKNQIEQDKEDEKKTEEMLTSTDKAITEFAVEKEKTKNNNKLIEDSKVAYEKENHNKEQLEESIKSNEERFINIQSEYKNLKVINKNLSQLNTQIDKLTTLYLPAFEKLGTAEKKLIKISTLHKKEQNKIKEISRKKEEYINQKEEITKIIETYIDVEDKLHECEIKLIDKNNKYNILNELVKDIDTYIHREKKSDELKEEYKVKYKEYELKRAEYDKMDKMYKMAQAGILAKDLKEKEPCPVCGSITHPNITKLSKDVPSTDEIERLKEQYEQADKEATEVSTTIQGMKSYNESLKENILKVALKLEELHNYEQIDSKSKKQIDSLLDNIKEELVTLNKNVESLKNNIKLRNKNKEALLEIDNYLSQVNIKKEEVAKKIQLISEDYKKAEGEIKVIKETLPPEYETEKQIKENITNKKEEANILKKTIKKIEDDYNSLKTLITSEKVRLTDTNKRIVALNKAQAKIKNLTIEDTKVYDIKIKEQKIIKDDYENKIKQIHNNIKFNTHSYKSIKLKSEEIERIEIEYGNINELSRIANGEGKDIPMDFETYVLAVYFDEIIRAANLRLSPMTNNRFLLRRVNEKLDGRKKSGLDLEVLDVNTAYKIPRPVKTLSGGESFKAALSLALGLSDVIQSFAGGIVIEALFIDEGFGYLDSESLEQAINVLMDLSGCGNRMIGIVSHITELKERIDNQLIIEHDITGSVIKEIIS